MKIFFIVIILVVVCKGSELEISDNDYEFIDGIMVPKKAKITEQERKQDRKDTQEDEDDVTEDDAPEDESEKTKHLPTKCHGIV